MGIVLKNARFQLPAGVPPIERLVQSSRNLALAVEQLSLARGAQPTNLHDKTYAATPVKFRAWPDKLV